MDGNKTAPTSQSVDDFIALVENPTRRDEARVLLGIFKRASGYDPQMWGPSIIGFGRYHYEYASGRHGDAPMTGFSPRNAAHSIYVMPGFARYDAHLARLGKHRHSVSCLYLTRLAGRDLLALEEMITDSVAQMRARYEHWPL